MSSAQSTVMALLGVAGSLAAQQTWTVGSNGMFADLPPAVAAAGAGDTILLAPGYYSAATVDKGLTLVGLAFPVSIQGLRISGVPHHETVVVQELGANFFPGSTSPALRVENCPGLVLLENVQVSGINRVHAEFQNSGNIVMRACLLIAFDQPHVIATSHVTVDDTEFSGSPGFFSPSREILALIDSDVTLTQCHLGSTPSQPAQHAFSLVQSTLRLVATTWSLPGSTANAAAVGICPSTSQILLPTNPPTTATPTMTGCVTATGAELPSLSIDELVPASAVTLRLYADANRSAFIFAGLPAQTQIATPLGPLALLGSSYVLVFATAAVPTTGMLSVALPTLPPQIPAGTTFALQAAVAGPQTLRLSAPTMATVAR